MATSNHAEGLRDWFEIFRAGSYGDKGEYTAQDLQHVADSYNPDFHEAPAVIGHPDTNAPAYGWAKAVKYDAGKLFAKLGEDTDPNFEEMVRKGLFKKRSVSFYKKPDGLELRHIGFLGAQPPEVKGLAAIKFEEGFETAEVVFEEGSMAAQEKTLTFAEQFKAFFEEHFGAKNTAAQFSEADAKRLVETAVAPLAAKNTELETKLAKQATDFAERERKLVTGEHSGLVAEAVNKLRSAGKWVPAFEKMGLKVVFAELAKVTETIEFGEPDKDGKKAKVLPLDLLTNFLEKLPKIVPGGTAVDGKKVIEFSSARPTATRGQTVVDQNSEQLHALILEFQEKNPKVEYGEAMMQVASKHPELTVSGGMAAGAV
jgi:hypothetical protein